MSRARLIIFSALFGLILAAPAHGDGLIVKPTGTICNPPNSTIDCHEAYTLDDFFNQFVVLSQWGLGMTMILAVMMFIWAGFKFITAGGRSGVIDEGKKIIGGTITGLIIALLAFVIVNTVIMALTGSTISTRTLFGRIATVFAPGGNSAENAAKKGLVRPFAGVGITATNGSCHTDSKKWNTGCSSDHMQINCSDSDPVSGAVHGYQSLLINKKCTCLTTSTSDATQGVDGCYGPATAQCVEHFQAVNHLPLTGALDSDTLSALTSASSNDCNFAVSNPILSKLPKITAPEINNQSTSSTGCCLVGTNDATSYCVDNVSANTCDALSSRTDHYDQDHYCASSPKFRHSCGFCSNAVGHAFQFATERWCKEVAGTPNGDLLTHDLTFTEGTCSSRASVSSCTNALLLSPLP